MPKNPISKTKDARTFAPLPVSFTAAGLAKAAFQEIQDVRPPDDEHVVVADVTVTVGWRVEKKDD